MSNKNTLPIVTVLLSTYNGEKYLNEQIKSLVNQKNVTIEIVVRDDGSNDTTISILDCWKSKGVLNWYSGKNLGPANSYMDLVALAPCSDYYAFCDQDDVWLPDKLCIAVSYLSKTQNKPALYFSQTQLVDEALNKIPSVQISPKCTLQEALIMYYVTGCTVVFNRTLLDMLRLYQPQYISMHDSWAYRVCLVTNGDIYFDPVSHILYRQHSNNVVGLRRSFVKEWKRRFLNSFLRAKSERYHVTEELFKGYSSFMNESQSELITCILNYKRSLKDRLSLFLRKDMTVYNKRVLFFYKVSVILGLY